jgi:hypothetical protein
MHAENLEINRLVVVPNIESFGHPAVAGLLVYHGVLDTPSPIVPLPIETEKPVGNGHADDVLRQIEVTTEVAKSLKQIAFQRPDQRPFVVSVPAPKH